MGNSDYSEEVTATTQLDGFPMPLRVSYDPSTGQVAINMANTCLQLVAQVELRDDDGEWRTFNRIPVAGLTHKELLVPLSSPSPVSTISEISPASLGSDDYVRVRLCLQSPGDNMCGTYVKAESKFEKHFAFSEHKSDCVRFCFSWTDLHQGNCSDPHTDFGRHCCVRCCLCDVCGDGVHFLQVQAHPEEERQERPPGGDPKVSFVTFGFPLCYPVTVFSHDYLFFVFIIVLVLVPIS